MRERSRAVHVRSPYVLPLAALLLAATLSACPAAAQMVPLADQRQLGASVTAFELFDVMNKTPPTPFGYWSDQAWVQIDNPDPNGAGYCSSGAEQVSQFGSSYISASGSCSANWDVYPGAYTALSLAKFRFRVDACVQYQLDAWFTPGDQPGGDGIRLRSEPSGLILYEVTSGELHITGRLSPGEYSIEGRSAIANSDMYTEGSVYSILWTAVPCNSPPPIITVQPRDSLVSCGASPTFTVGTSAPSPTYQWRRNLVALSNNGHFSGVSGPTLSVHNACTLDVGYFDVLVTSGGVTEPSRMAHLTMTSGSAGVGDEPAAGIPGLVLEAAGPNPFRAATSFRYALPRPQRLRIEVLDASGARLRTLLDGVVGGTGSVSWDGTTNAGARVPAGIYFLSAEAEGARATRKIVLLH